MSDDIFLRPPPSWKGLWLGLGLVVLLAAGGWVGRQLWLAQRPAAPPAAVGPLEQAAASPAASALPAPAAPDESVAKLAAARRAWQADRGQEARDIARPLLEQATPAAVRSAAEALLGEVNTALVFSRRLMAEKTDVTVQAGDTLGTLARKFATTKELIRQGNNFTGDVIRVGDRLRIFSSPFAVQASRTRNELVLSAGGHFFKRYPIGTGQFSVTPTGTFHIVSRIAGPTWYRAGGAPVPYGDTNNVLGTHWLALDIPHYGLHGTWDTNTIGKQSSQGCIRLLNENIQELYTLLPEGTPVSIGE
ncbi:MAG: L,D-transpeptidase family protein [Kiritimatiellaeota bacterium]|nr:L,D-transpeptidase family protein [Kiritimatiellota bacterium]